MFGGVLLGWETEVVGKNGATVIDRSVYAPRFVGQVGVCRRRRTCRMLFLRRLQEL